MPYRFWVVEDDHLDAEAIRQGLEVHFKRAEVVVMRTERDFCQAIESQSERRPDLIIIDVMLPWAFPEEEMTEEDIPRQVLEEGFYTAGLRCANRLKANGRLAQVPYLLYTGLTQNNFKNDIIHTKSDDILPLIRAIVLKLGAKAE
jgi:CheY-like chemotaxis protein